MQWSDHIDYIHSKVAKRLGLLKRVKHLLPVKSREIMYNTMIRPILDYGDIVWEDNFNQTQMDRLQVLQNKGAKIILNKPVYSSSTSALASLGWKTLKVKRQFHRSLFFFKCSQNMSDFNFNLAHRSSIHNYCTRSSSEFVTPKYMTSWGQSKSDDLFVKEFNLLSNTVKFSKSVSGFGARLLQLSSHLRRLESVWDDQEITFLVVRWTTKTILLTTTTTTTTKDFIP